MKMVICSLLLLTGEKWTVVCPASSNMLFQVLPTLLAVVI